MLVGTHLELRNDKETLEKLAGLHETPISYSQGLQLKREIGAARYIECSARTQENLKRVFDVAAMIVLCNYHQLCAICKKVITRGAIFCEGECNAWLHKRCAGFSLFSKTSFKTTDEPFYCPRCITKPKSCSEASAGKQLYAWSSCDAGWLEGI